MHKVLCTSREPLLLFVSAGVRQARGEEAGRRRGNESARRNEMYYVGRGRGGESGRAEKNGWGRGSESARRNEIYYVGGEEKEEEVKKPRRKKKAGRRRRKSREKAPRKK